MGASRVWVCGLRDGRMLAFVRGCVCVCVGGVGGCACGCVFVFVCMRVGVCVSVRVQEMYCRAQLDRFGG